MFGSEITAEVLTRELKAINEVTADVGDRVFASLIVPGDADLPALIFYMEDAPYGGPLGTRPAGAITQQIVRFVVRILTEGQSTNPIINAAEAQLAHLDGRRVDTVWRGWNYTLTFTALGEVPITNFVEDATNYRQLGTVYEAEVSRGGKAVNEG